MFGKFASQIEEWRGRDLSWLFGNEKLHLFILALFEKTVIGPFFDARLGPVPGPGARAPHPPNSKFPNLAPNGPGTPKNRIPRVRFMKIRAGGRSGDLNRTDLRPYLGLAQIGPRAPGSGPRALGPGLGPGSPGPGPNFGVSCQGVGGS